jgi:acyl-CoA dehydrogenase family protein 9
VRRVLGWALAHARQREQFGRPIGSFEMIQRKFAVAAAECYASDAAWMLTASMMDAGGTDFSLETAACKVYASELLYRGTNDAMQIAGGIGFSKEYPYEQAVRDARINLIFEGTNEILRALIALSGLQQPGEQLKAAGRAFSHPLQSIGAIGGYVAGRVKRQLVKPKFRQLHPALESEGDMVESAVHDLALGVERALVRHGKGIIERQFLQERMANAAIDIYVSVAVLSRASAALNAAGQSSGGALDLEYAQVFVPAAMRRVRRSVRALTRNQDARLKAMAERALESGELTLPPPTDV